MSSPKMSAPVLGFNHNLKFGPLVYHVQTEDSGLPHAHYITHLFVGGNVLASMKTSYADRAHDPDLARTVKALMEAQHKQMVRRLVSGEFSERVQQFAPHYEPGVLATGQTGPAAVNVGKGAPGHKISPPPPPRAAPGKPASATATPAPGSVPLPPPSGRPAAPSRPPGPTPMTATPPGGGRMPGAPLPQTTRLPPPQRHASPPMVSPVGRPPITSPLRATEPSLPPVPRPSAPLSANPFALAAAALGGKPVEAPTDGLPTLFAEELISEKSLDEVILAFLSADLEQGK